MKQYTLEVKYNQEKDEYYIELNDEILHESGFKIGDVLTYRKHEEKSWLLSNEVYVEGDEFEVVKSDVINILTNNIAYVTFMKKDNTERVMECTLMKDLLPEITSTDKKERKQNSQVIPVYDLENKAWRSFNIKSIKTIKVKDEKQEN